jgi:hypothetical protein
MKLAKRLSSKRATAASSVATISAAIDDRGRAVAPSHASDQAGVGDP